MTDTPNFHDLPDTDTGVKAYNFLTRAGLAGSARKPSVPPPPAPPTVPTVTPGVSDFQTLANALTALYGGGTTATTGSQTVPTAVVPVDSGTSGGGFSWGSLAPLFLLLTIAGLGLVAYRHWKRTHRKEG